MVEVTDINKNDEVYAKKELKMFGNVFAKEGDCFKVYDMNDKHVKITSDKIDLFLDTNTFYEHFKKKVVENKKEGNVPSFDMDKNIQNILDWSVLDKYSAFGKQVAMSCKLPNGFVITEHANTENECIEKIKRKIEELETYRIMTDEYEYQCWMNDVCFCDEDNCDCGNAPECFDIDRCADCDDYYDCDCYATYCNR